MKAEGYSQMKMTRLFALLAVLALLVAACGGSTASPSPSADASKAAYKACLALDVGGIGVETFSVPHDAADPVGFLLRTSAGNVGFLTDLGHATRLVVERVRPSHALVLEAKTEVP